MAYEAGYGFAGVDRPPAVEYPLAILAVYREPLQFDHLTGRSSGSPTIDVGSGGPAWPLPSRRSQAAEDGPVDVPFGLSRELYALRLERIVEYLRAGDCYQINFTDAFDLALPQDLSSIYNRLKRVQPTSYGAFLNFGNPTIASFSPELHFAARGGQLTARPMKGTAPRGTTLAEDRERRLALAADEKSRAENVMIVDLIRNDMGRLCRFGSIEVPELFGVHPFGNILQMTSTVRGVLREEPRLATLFPALFPSGSVTGAPKRRAMEIIRELESRPRGVYTGAIGYASPSGDMTFSVAIRTLVALNEAESGLPKRAVFGAGSGVVIDSSIRDEYDECLLKGRFIKSSDRSFELFETMRCEAGRVASAERHLDRLSDSARYFGYPFDRAEAEGMLNDRASILGAGIHRFRLILHRDGRFRLEVERFEDDGSTPIVGLAEERVDSRDVLLFHKTSLRGKQERALALARRHGITEMLFLNERGELTEGAVSNLFVEFKGRLLTPPLSSGLLPGVGRAQVLEGRADAQEAVLHPEDLLDADSIYLCSSLRGLRRAELSRNWALRSA